MRPDSSEGTDPAPDVELEGRLAEAHAAVLARETARRKALRELPPPKPGAAAGWLAAASTAWLAVALVLLSPPAFLRGAAPRPFAPAVAQVEPSLRYGVWLARHRVATFARREGRLPSFLGETGIQDSTITMEATGESTYQLRGKAGGTVVVYQSAMSVDSFLGDSMERLRASR